MQAAAGAAYSGDGTAGSFSGDTVEGVVCQLAEQDIGTVNGMQTSCMARVRSVQQVRRVVASHYDKDYGMRST